MYATGLDATEILQRPGSHGKRLRLGGCMDNDVFSPA